MGSLGKYTKRKIILNFMAINETEFREVISALRDQNDYDKAKSIELSRAYGCDVPISDNSRLRNVIFDLLHKQFPPTDFCKIHCFCWDIDFGRATSSADAIGDLWEQLNADLKKSTS